MKIKSLLSLLACGVASQIMVGCASTGQYYDFSTPALSHQKAAPANKVTTIAPTEATAATAAERAPQTLEATAAKPAASAQVARTAPLTTSAVASAVTTAPAVENAARELSAATSKKDIKTFAKKLKREVREAKKANALDGYIRIGVILILIGLLVSILGGFAATIGSIVAVIGLIFLVLGLVNML